MSHATRKISSFRSSGAGLTSPLDVSPIVGQEPSSPAQGSLLSASSINHPLSHSPLADSLPEQIKTRQLLNRKQLQAIGIGFSREHLWRLEAAGRFPRRLYLSPQKVAWFADEIFDWLEKRAAERRDRVYRRHD